MLKVGLSHCMVIPMRASRMCMALKFTMSYCMALHKSEHTLSSSRVKPLPRRDLVLYLTVWPRTTGFRLPATGRGKTFLALSARAVCKIKGPQRQDPEVVTAAAIETEA